ncbi:MAG TPA: M56 family metallopeptidase [Planctomycetaceae bacterium]|nr:M56 family metallopeptidase [Planctomycetaceae bacterium]
MNDIQTWLSAALTERFASLLWLIVKLTVLLGTGWGVHFAVRKGNPRWKVLTWRMSAAGALLLAALALYPPFLSLSVLPAPSLSEESENHAGAPATRLELQPPRGISSPAIESRTWSAIGSRTRPPEIATRTAPAPPEVGLADPPGILPVSTEAASRDPSRSLLTSTRDTHWGRASVPWVVGLWFVGACLMALRAAIGLTQVRRIRRQATAVPEWVCSEAARVAAALGVTRRFRVRQSRDVQSPCLSGSFDPLILIPTDLVDARRDDELPSILAHELAHLLGADVAWNALLSGLSAALWFHPLIWRARLAHADACDAVSDAIAADYVGDAEAYSRTLARLVLRTGSGRVAAGLSMAHLSGIGRRIAALKEQVFRDRLSYRKVLCILSAGVAVIFVLGGLVLTRSHAYSRPAAPRQDGVVALATKGKSSPQITTTALAQTSTSNERPHPEATASPNHSRNTERFADRLFLLQNHKIHISGRATNQDGKPVTGATVYVLKNADRYVLEQPLIGATKTDVDGKYAFRDLPLPVMELKPEPVPQPIEGGFQVIAMAPTYGFTWRRRMTYRPTARTSESEPEATVERSIFYLNESIPIDLHFQPEARLRGRITNDFGEPLPGAGIHLGVTEDVRRGDSRLRWTGMARYNETSPLAADGSCNVIYQVRELFQPFLWTRADADGRYEIRGLPRDAHLSAQIEFGKDYVPHSFTLATSNGPSDSRRLITSSGYDGEFNYSFPAPREIRIHVTEGSSERPVANAVLRVQGRKISRTGATSRTDKDGNAALGLSPGTYRLMAEPAWGVPLVRQTRELTIEGPSRSYTVAMALPLAATVMLKAVEEGTGMPIEGAAAYTEVDGSGKAVRLQSQTTFTDNPVTDAGGILRAVVPPGRRRFFIQRTIRPATRRFATEWADLSLGKETSVTVTVGREEDKAVSLPPPLVKFSRAQETWERMRQLSYRQWLLGARGRYRIRINNYMRSNIKHEDLVAILEACQGKKQDEIVTALLHGAFPDARALGYQEATFDRDRSRVSWVDAKADADGQRRINSTFVFNGYETITYERDNAQCDLWDVENNSMGSTGTNDLFHSLWPSANKPTPIHWRDGMDMRMTSQNGRLQFESAGGNVRNLVLIDETTGFIFRQRIEIPQYKNVRETWQFLPQSQPNGAVLPGVHFHCEYSDQKLNRAAVTVIDEAALMDHVSPETFVVAVEPGTNVIDHRGISREEMNSNPRPRSAVVNEAVSDVVSRANEFAPRKRPVVVAGDKAPPIDVAKWTSGEAAPAIAGKIVLVTFSAIWCGPCDKVSDEIRDAAKVFPKDQVCVVGVYDAGDTDENLKKLVDKKKLTFSIAIDKPGPRKNGLGKTAQAFGIDAVPTTAVIDREGKIAYIGHLQVALQTVARLLKPPTL